MLNLALGIVIKVIPLLDFVVDVVFSIVVVVSMDVVTVDSRASVVLVVSGIDVVSVAEKRFTDNQS